MIISPIYYGQREQWRARISQKFGENPRMYSQFGMLGHNGVDFALPVGTPIYASISGFLRFKNSGKFGYGLHIKQRSAERGLECVYGHLSKVRMNVIEEGFVNQGDLIGWSGNTGFSTGPHLHFGVRRISALPLVTMNVRELFESSVKNYENGYFGYFDFLPFLI